MHEVAWFCWKYEISIDSSWCIWCMNNWEGASTIKIQGGQLKVLRCYKEVLTIAHLTTFCKQLIDVHCIFHQNLHCVTLTFVALQPSPNIPPYLPNSCSKSKFEVIQQGKTPQTAISSWFSHSLSPTPGASSASTFGLCSLWAFGWPRRVISEFLFVLFRPFGFCVRTIAVHKMSKMLT